MARIDPPLYVNVPQFVHDDLDHLRTALAAEAANQTNLVGALIHAATVAQARSALGRYREDERAYREGQTTALPE
jgi:hypothetical protein